ncbi:helix-turn-helix domain-containing protein [Flagellimonas flava]|uniref:AraC family transcriptional regulator n=1 Tax=Flagellimonas TaxID=444459 RepID=UPI003D65EA4A
MDQTNTDTIFLKKGHYLAPCFSTSNFGDFLIGITKYETPVETGNLHSHEKPMISFVLHGNNTEVRRGKMIERTTGCTNYYSAHEQHRNIYNRFPARHVSIEFEYDFLKKYEYTEEQVELAVKKSYDAIFTFIKLMKEAHVNDAQSKSTAEMLFLSFMGNSLSSNNDTQIPSWMKSVRDILNDRWNENLSLKELAENVNIHPTTISKHFKRYFQSTLGEYTRKLKVTRSIDILHSSNCSLTEISYICGFSDQSHFTRTFKSMTGYLPKDYIKL